MFFLNFQTQIFYELFFINLNEKMVSIIDVTHDHSSIFEDALPKLQKYQNICFRSFVFISKNIFLPKINKKNTEKS